MAPYHSAANAKVTTSTVEAVERIRPLDRRQKKKGIGHGLGATGLALRPFSAWGRLGKDDLHVMQSDTA